MQNVYIAAVGGGLAAAAHPGDQAFNAKLLSHYDGVNAAFAPGKYLGNTAEQVAASARHLCRSGAGATSQRSRTSAWISSRRRF